MAQRRLRLGFAAAFTKSSSLYTLTIALAIAVSAGRPIAAATPWDPSVVAVSIPANSMDSFCHPVDDNVWSVATPPFPLAFTGIGYLLDPTLAGSTSDVTLHDHVYVASNVPDPARAVVTYVFDVPVAVDQVEIVQHANGVSRVEGFVGDALDAMVSIGNVFGPDGDVTGANVFDEGEPTVFDFDNTTEGRYFQLVIRKTPLHDGYALYRAFPRTSDGTRIAAATQDRSLDFYTVTPCRLLDTTAGGGPALADGVARTITVEGACGVPTTARSVALNVTATMPTGAGEVSISPPGGHPSTSSVSFSTGQTRAVNTVVVLSAGEVSLAANVAGSGTVHVILDVVGYFE